MLLRAAAAAAAGGTGSETGSQEREGTKEMQPFDTLPCDVLLNAPSAHPTGREAGTSEGRGHQQFRERRRPAHRARPPTIKDARVRDEPADQYTIQISEPDSSRSRTATPVAPPPPSPIPFPPAEASAFAAAAVPYGHENNSSAAPSTPASPLRQSVRPTVSILRQATRATKQTRHASISVHCSKDERTAVLSAGESSADREATSTARREVTSATVMGTFGRRVLSDPWQQSSGPARENTGATVTFTTPFPDRNLTLPSALRGRLTRKATRTALLCTQSELASGMRSGRQLDVEEARIAVQRALRQKGLNCGPLAERATRVVWQFPYVATFWFIFWGTLLLAVLDRFTWNVWPRQSFNCAAPGNCGEDYGSDEPHWTLIGGPASVKAYDVIVRATSRITIWTINGLFLTMCHNSYNWWCERSKHVAGIFDFRYANVRIHRTLGVVLAVAVMSHMWAIFLPVVFGGWGGGVKLKDAIVSCCPSTVGKVVSNGSAAGHFLANAFVLKEESVNLDADDVWRLAGITPIITVVLPLSMSGWLLRCFNWSIAIKFHLAAGLVFFLDLVRRKWHPHCWVLNLPVFFFWCVDRFYLGSLRTYRCRPVARVRLDDNYVLLFWKHPEQWCVANGGMGRFPSFVGDVYELKRVGQPRWESAHPFTCVSLPPVHTDEEREIRQTVLPGEGRQSPITSFPAIPNEQQLDPSWEGHKYALQSGTPTISPRFRRKETMFNSNDDVDVEVSRNRTVAQVGAQIHVTLQPVATVQTTVTADPATGTEYEATDGTSTHRTQHGTPQVVQYDTSQERDQEAQDMSRSTRPPPSESPPRFAHRPAAGWGAEGALAGSLCPPAPPALAGAGGAGDGSGTPRGVILRDLTGCTDQGVMQQRSATACSAIPSSDSPKLCTFSVLKTNTTSTERHGISTVSQACEIADDDVSYDAFAIIQVHRGMRGDRSFSAGVWDSDTEHIELEVTGPWHSAYARLSSAPVLPPMVLVATGAAASYVMDFVCLLFIREMTLTFPMHIYYTSRSLPLLQFVTDFIMSRPVEMVEVHAALTSAKGIDHELDHSDRSLQVGRLHLKEVVENAPPGAEVHFCGSPGLQERVQVLCEEAGIRFFGGHTFGE